MKNQNEKRKRHLSKFLSLVLRHKPETIEIELDENGWTGVEKLIDALNKAGKQVSLDELREVVATNAKQRFNFSECGNQIRANQGHSVDIDLGYQATVPPEFLYHGAATKDLPLIQASGLKKMKRHDVHLHARPEPCIQVAKRHGKPVILRVAAQRMFESGYEFFETPNQVWLTDKVPVEFIEFDGQSF